MFVSCNNDEPSKPTGLADRTVIVYMAAENNLSTPFAEIDTTEMIAGSKKLTDSQNYIVFVDKAEKARPTIWKFEKGQRKLLKEFQEDFYSSDPAKMKEILSSRTIRWNIPQREAVCAVPMAVIRVTTVHVLTMWANGSTFPLWPRC